GRPQRHHPPRDPTRFRGDVRDVDAGDRREEQRPCDDGQDGGQRAHAWPPLPVSMARAAPGLASAPNWLIVAEMALTRRSAQEQVPTGTAGTRGPSTPIPPPTVFFAGHALRDLHPS